jgi:hypothetical protein
LRGAYQRTFYIKTLFSEKRVSKYGHLTVPATTEMETDFVSSRTRKAVVRIVQGRVFTFLLKLDQQLITQALAIKGHYHENAYDNITAKFSLGLLLPLFFLVRYKLKSILMKLLLHCPYTVYYKHAMRGLQCSNASLSIRICKVMNNWKSITKERRYGKSDCPLSAA